MDALSTADVAIVGAGPIGLLLAGELAAGGARTIVLERAAAPSPIPKANGIVGRAAVGLKHRGVFRGSRVHVLPPPRFFFGPLELRLGFGPGNPLRIAPVPQRRLEELLERRAVDRGAEVRRGREVVDFTQREDGVELDVRAGEAVELLGARYLVGCDGAHSLVRKRAGIGFPGITAESISRIARVTIPAGVLVRSGDGFELPGAGHLAAMRPNTLAGGTFSIAPVSALDRGAPDDLYLVSTHEPRGDAVPSDTLPIEELRASLRRVLGADLPFTEAEAARSTVGNSRLADAYRVGRAFLAGDAAHVFNAGGSALNGGILDVLDLAPRLIAAVRGSSDAGLDGYEAMRRPAGERALRHTRAQAVLSRDDETGVAMREVMSALVSSRSAARRLARLLQDG